MRHTLEQGERTITTIRKHWFVLLRDLVFAFLLYLLPIVAYLFLQFMPSLGGESALPSLSVPANILFFLLVLWTFLFWLRLFGVWTDYYLDTWTVTTKRVIDIEQEGFFRRRVGSFRIDKIQDITVSVTGIIPTLLDFGSIHVETAGSNTDEFTIVDIPNPRRLKDQMNRELDVVLDRKSQL